MLISLAFVCIFVLVCLSVLLTARVAEAAFFNLSRYDNSPFDGASCMVVMPDNSSDSAFSIKQQPSFVPLKESRLVGRVDGPLAGLSLSQKYAFTEKQSAKPLEVLYRFPLPGDAAVKGAVVRFGDVEIKTSLKEREEARFEYDTAKSEGRQAAFVSRESEDSFTLRITGIEPDVEVEVIVDFITVARPAEPGWELRFPLTVPPRYVRKDEADAVADANPLAIAIDPGHRFSMELELRYATDIASSTHEISASIRDNVSTVTLTQGTVTPDRDLLLSWRPDVGENSLGGRLYTEEDGDDTYFLLLAAANEPDKNALPTLKREVSLLIDHSGSMEGPKWEAADWAAKKFLLDLKEDDYFAVAFFHSHVFPLSKTMLEANPQNVAKAVSFVTENRSSGGTNLGAALELMLMIPKVLPQAQKKLARQVLVITDAQVTDKGRILGLASLESLNETKRRISVLCIDASPNSTLTNRLAERGGGTAAYLTSAPTAEDITTAVDEILSRWSRPVAESVVLEIDAKALRVAGKKATMKSDGFSVELGSLMGGEPLWIVGKASGFKAENRVRVHFDETAVDVTVTPKEVLLGQSGAIRSLYGARQIQELEFLKTSWLTGDELQNELSLLGYAAREEKKTVYEENKRAAAKAMLDALLLEESLKYGVVSSATALVASRTEKGKIVEVVENTVLVPNALPHGWSSESLTLRQCLADPSLAERVLGIRECVAPPRPAENYSPSEAKDISSGHPKPTSPGRSIDSFISWMFDDSHDEASERGKTTVHSGAVALSAGEELVLKEIFGSGRLCAISLSHKKIAPLAGTLEGLNIRVYADNGVRPAASVKLVDLVKLGGKRPLNISYAQSVRIVMVNESSESVRLEKFSIFVM